MSIYIQVRSVIIPDIWHFNYYKTNDLFCTTTYQRVTPCTTLQGSSDLLIDIDQNSKIVSFESVLTSSSRFWKKEDTLICPDTELGQAYVVQDIYDNEPIRYFTNSDYSIFYTRFGEVTNPKSIQHIAIAQQITLGLKSDGKLAGIWINYLPPEIQQYHLRHKI